MTEPTIKPETARTLSPDGRGSTAALLGLLTVSVAVAAAAGWLASKHWTSLQPAADAPSP
jgi:hypothetical protein